MKVIALKAVIQYLNNLVLILYEKGYFGFKESSRDYVIELFNGENIYQVRYIGNNHTIAQYL